MPWLLIQMGAPEVSPAALGPWLASIRRKGSRRERRELRRQSLNSVLGRLTGRYRRELREAEARRDATFAEAKRRRTGDHRSWMQEDSFWAADPIPDGVSGDTVFYDACILAAHIETNVPQGGDAGHGGRTRLSLRDEGSFAFGMPAG
jgi:hypothetical protein